MIKDLIFQILCEFYINLNYNIIMIDFIKYPSNKSKSIDIINE